MQKFLAAILSCLVIIGVVPASATVYPQADPNVLIAIASEQTGVHDDVDSMVEAGILTTGERTLIKTKGLITRAVAWRSLLPVFGIYPYPASCYPNVPLDERATGDYADARCTAILLGLATKEENPNLIMSKSELDTLIVSLKSGVKPLPKIQTGIPYIDEIDSWGIESYEGRNSLIQAYQKIPDNWMKVFDQKGWEFKFEVPENICPKKTHLSNYTIAGSCNYTNKKINIGNSKPLVTLHEMSHFIVHQASVQDNVLRTAYRTEAAATKSILGAYALTDSNEYIAEFTGCWLMYPEQHDTLCTLAPKTVKIVDKLVNYKCQ